LPSHVNCCGTGSPCANAGLVTVNAMSEPSVSSYLLNADRASDEAQI
jgi:hypothetical protein